MASWFAMGDYGGYIWTAYGLSALALGVLTILSWRSYVRAKKEVRDMGAGQGK